MAWSTKNKRKELRQTSREYTTEIKAGVFNNWMIESLVIVMGGRVFLNETNENKYEKL
jgi:hypothetical protein